MIEADLNATIVRSLHAIGGWGWKIPDATRVEIESGFSYKRPFDITGLHPVAGSVSIESKFNQGQTTFAFSRFEEQQVYHLDLVRKSIQKGAPGLSLAAFGAWEPRKYFEVFFFDFGLVKRLIDLNVSSISRKDLELMRNKGKVFNITKNLISDFRDLPQRVITDGDFPDGYFEPRARARKDVTVPKAMLELFEAD